MLLKISFVVVENLLCRCCWKSPLLLLLEISFCCCWKSPLLLLLEISFVVVVVVVESLLICVLLQKGVTVEDLKAEMITKFELVRFSDC